MEYIVKVEGNEIARFKAREDAEHFAQWKRDELAKAFTVIIEEDLPSLTVRDIDNELVLGSRYAVEVESWRMTEDGEETEDYQTYHYKVGEVTRNPYMRHKVRSIRGCGSELYRSVSEERKASEVI